MGRTGLRTAALFALAVGIMACSELGETPSSPQRQVEETPAPIAAPSPTPQAVAAPAHEGREMSWGSWGSGSIKNTTDIPQVYWACALRANTDLAGVATTGPQGVRPGETWDFDLKTGCVQLDVTQNGCAAGFHPIEFNWYDEKGRAVGHPSRVDWALCDPGEPVCTPTWLPLNYVTTTYGEWQTCRYTSNTACARSRTKTVVVQEKNSCTNELREKSRTTTIEAEPCKCTPQCEPK